MRAFPVPAADAIDADALWRISDVLGSLLKVTGGATKKGGPSDAGDRRAWGRLISAMPEARVWQCGRDGGAPRALIPSERRHLRLRRTSLSSANLSRLAPETSRPASVDFSSVDGMRGTAPAPRRYRETFPSL